MNEKTLTALKGSIEKWERIVDHEGTDNGPLNCDLCGLFFNWNQNYDESCNGCPVGEKYCYQSPYYDWDHYHRALNHDLPVRVFDKYSYNLALAELNFLKSLLPKDKP